MEEFMSLKQIAETLQVTYQTVHKYIKNETLKAVKVGGTWRVPKKDFEAFLQSGKKTEDD